MHQPKYNGYANMTHHKSFILAQKQWTFQSLFNSSVQQQAACQDVPLSRDASHDYSSRLSESLSHQILIKQIGNKRAEMLKY